MTAMMATVIDRPPSLFDAPEHERDDAPTLESVVLDAWDALQLGRTVACPVCPGELAGRPSAGAGVAGGRCRDCGTHLG